MPGTIGAPAHLEVGASLEQPIQDRLGEVAIMQHLPPRRQRLVRGHEHRLPAQIPLVDHAIEHVRRIGTQTSDQGNILPVARYSRHSLYSEELVSFDTASAQYDPTNLFRLNQNIPPLK